MHTGAPSPGANAARPKSAAGIVNTPGQMRGTIDYSLLVPLRLPDRWVETEARAITPAVGIEEQ